jgi:hypothetical protein
MYPQHSNKKKRKKKIHTSDRYKIKIKSIKKRLPSTYPACGIHAIGQSLTDPESPISFKSRFPQEACEWPSLNTGPMG